MHNFTKKLPLFLLACFVILAVYVGLRYVLGGNLVIDLGSVDMNNTQIFINGQAQNLYGYNESAKSARFNDRFGRVEIKIYSAGYEAYEQTLSVYTRGDTAATPQLREIPAQTTAAELAAKDAKIESASYTTNATTGERLLVFTVAGNDAKLTGRFDRNQNKWTLNEPDN